MPSTATRSTRTPATPGGGRCSRSLGSGCCRWTAPGSSPSRTSARPSRSTPTTYGAVSGSGVSVVSASSTRRSSTFPQTSQTPSARPRPKYARPKTASWVGRNSEHESPVGTGERRAAASTAGAANEGTTGQALRGVRTGCGRTKIVAPALPAATCTWCVPPNASLSLPAPTQDAVLGRGYRHQHAPLARSVELDEHDRLPRAQLEASVLHGDRLAGSEERRLDVRRRVPVDAIVPPDAGGSQAAERIEHVGADVGVVVLVDHDGGSGVRDVDAAQPLCQPAARDDLGHPSRQINHFALGSGPYSQLRHGMHSTSWSGCPRRCPRPRTVLRRNPAARPRASDDRRRLRRRVARARSARR